MLQLNKPLKNMPYFRNHKNKKNDKKVRLRKKTNRYTNQRSSQYEQILASNKADLDNLRIFYF
jgi:hypothetical protein